MAAPRLDRGERAVMSILSLTTVLAMAYGAFGSRGYGYALALGGATASGAAVIAGRVVVPTFYAVAMGTALCLLWRMLSGTGTDRATRAAGEGLLVALLLWSGLVTVVAPVLFDGTVVLSSVGADMQLVAGELSTSNVAQLIYLALGVCVTVFLGRSGHRYGPEIVGLAAGLTTVLSAWRYGNEWFGLPFPEKLFDNSPNFAYIETAAGGIQRFRGILSEPAGLAISCLVTMSYMLSRAAGVRGRRRAAALALAAVAAFLGSVSTSTTFIIAGLLLAGIALAAGTWAFVLRRNLARPAVGVACCAAIIGLTLLLPDLRGFVVSTIHGKLSSGSYVDRSNADQVSYRLLLDTYGIGVGVGSNRAASFLPELLSSIGLVGGLLFVAMIVRIIGNGRVRRELRPAIWALLAVVVAKLVAGPDLSDSSGILWLSLGVLAQPTAGATTGATRLEMTTRSPG